MKFADPYLLNLLWTLIIVFGIFCYGMMTRRKIIQAFLGAEMLTAMAPGYSPARRWIRAALVICACALGIVALAGPQAGFRWEKVEQRGVDIMIALDCSRSMLAQDIKPDRLSRAKREIIDLLKMMKSDRAGLVAFSGNAILQCPLTLDREAFHIFLNVLGPDYFSVGGTDIDAAIKASANGFEKDSDTEKAIILITDGENTLGQAEETAKEMAQKNIKVFCVGVGDIDGAPIPDENGGFKKDRSGNIVLSKVDEQGLKKIATITGGAYVRSVAGDMDLDLIYREKISGSMEKNTLVSDKKKVWENRFQWFLFPCVILLIIELLLPPIKKMKPAGSLIIAFVVLLGISGISGIVEAKMVSSSVKKGITAFENNDFEAAKKHFIDAQLEDPENEALYYNIGTAAYMNNEFEQARKNFGQAALAKDSGLRHKALYNLANTHYKLGDFDESIKGYEKILEEFPEDAQAKENLEFVKQKKQEQQEQQNRNSDQNQNQDDQKQEGEDSRKDQEQNPEDQQNQDNKNQDNKKQDQQQESSSEKEQPENKESDSKDRDGKSDSGGQDTRDSDSGREQDGQEDQEQQVPQPRPQENKGDNDQQDQASAGAGQDSGTGDPGQTDDMSGSQVDQMLNRLEDKPGRAMMPAARKRQIEKDW